MAIVSGANHKKMVRQLLSDMALTDSEFKLATSSSSETVANWNSRSDAFAIQISPSTIMRLYQAKEVPTQKNVEAKRSDCLERIH